VHALVVRGGAEHLGGVDPEILVLDEVRAHEFERTDLIHVGQLADGFDLVIAEQLPPPSLFRGELLTGLERPYQEKG
jgi:hypothetical protein